MQRLKPFLPVLLSLLAIKGFCQSPTAPALGFGIFIENNASLITSNSGGPVALGGDLTLTGSGYQIANNNAGTYQVGGLNIGLLVGGQVIYSGGNSFQINSNAYVKIGTAGNSYVWYTDPNNAYSPIRITNGANYNGYPRLELQGNAQNLNVSASNNPVFQSGLINFTTAFNTMRNTSTGISTCTDNANLMNANGVAIPHTGLPSQVKLGLNPGTNVLNLTGADMNAVSNFIYNNTPNASQVVVINVNAPGTFTWNVWSPGGIGPSDAPYVIYNFYNTTTLNIQGNGSIEGTIFAPYADLNKTNSSSVSGQIIAKSFIHNGGNHNYAVFTPSVTGCNVTPTVPAFTINNNNQCILANSFVFTNNSTGGGTLTYNWSFGDNTTSTATNPTKTYSAAGTYTVKLKVTGTGGVDSVSQTVTVNPTVAPSVSIAAAPGSSICSGTSVTFTATPTNGGPSPTYQWKKNTVNVGTNSPTYTNANLTNNDAIICLLTSNASCIATSAATSNTITMAVTAPVTPSVTIAANPGNTTCSGTSVTFTATPTNGGTAPTYQWKKNNLNVGSGGNTYTSSALVNGDVITCVLTSNASCVTTNTATSTGITLTVNPIPAQPGAFTTSSATVARNQTGVVYEVPNVAGTTYNWSYSGTGAVISGSGNSITINFGSTATSGTLSVTATSTAGCGPSVARTIAITVNNYMTWTCQTGIDWNTAANWDGGVVPSGNIGVLVPSNASCNPTIATGVFTCGNLTIAAGKELKVETGAKLNVKGDVSINGKVTGNGTLKLTGTTAQAISGNGRIDNLELANSHGAAINPGDTLHIGVSYNPTAGTLTTNGGFELLSDSIGTAVILSNTASCNYISGEVICDKYIHGGRRAFRFLGHPFSQSIPLSQLTPYIDITGQGGSANGFTTTTTNNPSSYWYNTLTGNGSTVNDSTGWIPFTHTNGAGVNAWNPRQGIRVYVRGAKGEGLTGSNYTPSATTIKTHGPVNQCDITVSCQTNANAGFNFLSNPYACNIDLSMATRGSAIGANFNVWDPNQGIFGAYVAQPFSYAYILPAYSSFVTTCTANTNNTIVFHESDKTIANATGSLFKTTSGFGNNVVQLRIRSNNDSLSWDRMLLFFKGTGAAATDPLDNKKLGNPNLDFYSFSATGDPLSIDVRPFAAGAIIPLGIKTDVLQHYTIYAEDFDIPAGKELYLHDKYLNNLQQITLGMSYGFDITSDPLSQGDNRFEINAVNATGIGTGLINPSREIMIFPNPASSQVTVSLDLANAAGTTILITDLFGRVVYQKDLGRVQAGSIDIPLAGLPQGVYTVSVNCDGQIINRKLVKN